MVLRALQGSEAMLPTWKGLTMGLDNFLALADGLLIAIGRANRAGRVS